MKPKWVTLGALAIAACVLVMVVLGYVRGAPRREMIKTLRVYEAAVQAGDAAGVLKVTAPAALASIRTAIDRARKDSAAELQSRSFQEMIHVLDLRYRHTASQLAKLTPEDEVRRIFAKPDPKKGGSLTITDVTIEGDKAHGWLAIDDGNDSYSGIGTGVFFERVQGVWLFDWKMKDRAIMERVSSALDDRAKFKIIDESIRAEYPNADLPSLWRGPRP